LPSMRVFAPLVLASLIGSCTPILQYADELADEQTGRSLLVTLPASVGGFAGFVCGLPVDLVALPVTYFLYSRQKEKDPQKADALSTLMLPSFVLWRTGTLVAAPFDALEFAVYRAWIPAETKTEDDAAQLEQEKDDATLPSYPVKEILYPRK